MWLSHKGRVDVRLTHEQSRYMDEQLRYARARDVDTTTLDVSGTLYGNRQIAGWRLGHWPITTRWINCSTAPRAKARGNLPAIGWLPLA